MYGKPLKVLVSAYACNPYRGSEEGVGWGWVKAISRYHKVWVLTAEYHRSDIERATNKNPDQFHNLTFIYVPSKPWHYRPTSGWIFIERTLLKPIMNNAYRIWQNDAYALAVEYHKKIVFDISHQITYVGFRFPGKLWKLNIPFVWGPIGGLENTPLHLLAKIGFKGFAYYLLRNIVNGLDKKFLPGPKRAFARAQGGIIAATSGIRSEILKYFKRNSKVICEIGSPDETVTHYCCRQPGDPIQLAWSGQHEPGKALPILLNSVASLPTLLNWDLHILGSGSCTQRWQLHAERLGIGPHCLWTGLLNRDRAINKIKQSHIFIITSIKDLTSTVLLEAISQGVPVICLDHCGFSDVVTDHCGIKIALNNHQQMITDINKAIIKLHDDESLRRRLAQGALDRSHYFTWEKKSIDINAIYQDVVDSNHDRRT